MANATPSVPDVILELYLLGELPPEEMTRIAGLEEQDPTLTARLEMLRKSNEEILITHPAAAFTAAVERKVSPTSRRSEVQTPDGFLNWSRRKWYIMAPAVAAAALLLMMIRIAPLSDGPGGPAMVIAPDITRPKSTGAEIHVYRQSGTDIEELDNLSLVANHDRLQISYSALGWPYGVIFSIDGRGAVTLHYPANESSSTMLDKHGEAEIPYGYEIDNAPDFERFFLVSSKQPIDVASLLIRARDFARDPRQALRHTIILGNECELDTLTVRKKETQL